MTPESWFVLTAAAAFLLLGIAGSPLAWVALHHRKSRLEEKLEKRWLELSARLDKLEAELAGLESSAQARAEAKEPPRSKAAPRGRFLPHKHLKGPGQERLEVKAPGVADDEPLIAVPNLSLPTPNDRDAAVNGLTQRYAAIWTLADQGASPEVIARATGQPVGQIELILGLRRQIDGNRTAIPHAPHG
jgi:hypothetical protein